MTTKLVLNRWIVPLFALASLALTIILYGDTITLSLFNDDPVYVRVVHDVTLIQLFTSRTSNPFYRPMNFLPLELLQMTIGSTPAMPLHILSLMLHAFNGWLVALLARRIFPTRALMAWLAMALYITFPFSYQAVPYVAAMGHIQAATGLLLAVLCLDHWLESRRWWLLMCLALSTILANFAHEGGVVTSALLAAWLFISRYGFSPRQLLRDWKTAALGLSPAIAVNAFYLLIWRQLSNNPAEPANILASIPLNILYFAQGLAYPITQFGFRLSNQASLSPNSAALILALIGVAILVAGLIFFRDRRIWFGLAWFVITLLAPTILSDWFYVLTAPHLLMMASPGIALVWAGALDEFWSRRGMIGRSAAVLIAALALVGGTMFVRSRLALHTRMDHLYREIYTHIAEGSDGVVFFNLPAWITPKERTFALDSSGIVYMADYLSFNELVWANTGLEYSTPPVLWQDNLPHDDRFWMEPVNQFQPGLDERVAAVRSADRFYRVKTLPSQYVLEEAYPASPSEVADGLLFSNQVILLPRAYLIPDRRLVAVELTMQTLQGQVAEKLFVHLLCGDEIVMQADGALMGEIYPYDYWQAGETWHEIRLMEVSANIPTDCLNVRIGQFHPVSGVRPTLPDGAEWTIIPVEIRP